MRATYPIWYINLVGTEQEVRSTPAEYHGGLGYPILDGSFDGPGILVKDCVIIDSDFNMLKSHEAKT